MLSPSCSQLDPEFCCDAAGEETDCKGDTPRMCESWKKPQEIEITTVEDFVDDGMKVIEIQTNRVVSDAEYYNNRHIPDVEIKTPDKGTAECRSTTDPNYRQFDGSTFTVNTQGAFTLWNADYRDWEVQATVDDKGANCGVAVRDGCDRVVFNRCTGTFSMKKFFDPKGDPSLQPIVARSGSDTWILKSRRSGAQVKIVQRVHVTRSGRTTCGWSGCRTSFQSSRRDWLDVFMTAPGQDWGWQDAGSATQQTVPKIKGVCGRFTSDKGDDLFNEKTGQKKVISQSAYVSQFAVQPANNLFAVTPAQCQKAKQPLKVAKKQCSIAPRPVQKPVIGVFDIEDITEMLKNSLSTDDEDDGASFTFDLGQEKQPPVRSKAWEEKMMSFCRKAMLDTKFARECVKTDVRDTNTTMSNLAEKKDIKMVPIDLQQFVDSCYFDIWWQAPKCNEGKCTQAQEHEIDMAKNAFAASSYEALEAFCIENRAKDTKYTRTCKPENAGREGCQTDADSGVCVGDCTIEVADTLKAFVSEKCPNNCGRNFKEQDAGGDCVLLNITQTNGKRALRNRCVCSNPSLYGGDDCTILVGDFKPSLKRLSPSKCDTSDSSSKCPTEVSVFADDSVSLFARTDSPPKCMVNGKIVEGIFMSDSEIKCPLSADAQGTHGGSAKPLFHKVSVATDGSKFSQELSFCYHNSACTVCNRVNGKFTISEKTCAIEGKCYSRLAKDTTPTYGKCRTCRPDVSADSWHYDYTAQECQAQCQSSTITIGENTPFNVPFNLNNKIRRVNSLYGVHSDKINLPTYTIVSGDDTGMFRVSTKDGEGLLELTKGLDYTLQSKYELNIEVAQGGKTSQCKYTVEVSDSDDDAIFTQQVYTATVDEGVQGATTAQVQASITDLVGDVEYTIDGYTAGKKLPFSIDSKTGVISVASPLDFETMPEWNLRVYASQRGSVNVKITVVDQKEAPSSVKLSTTSISENAVVGQPAADIIVTDDDKGDTFTITMSDKGDIKASDYFQVQGAKLVLTKALNYEQFGGEIQFTLSAKDQTDRVGTSDVTVKIMDVNDAPGKISIMTALIGGQEVTTLGEDQVSSQACGFLTVQDEDTADVHTYEVVGANSGFEVRGNELFLTKQLDFERVGGKSVSVELRASDSESSSVSQKFTFAVTNADDVPRSFQFVGKPVAENTAADAVIGTIEAVDQDQGQDFEIKLRGNDAKRFTIGATTCTQVPARGTVCKAALKVADTSAIDFESHRKSAAEASKTVLVQSVQGQQQRDCRDCPVFAITDVNEAPTGVEVYDTRDTVTTADGMIQVKVGKIIIGTVSPKDADIACPADLPGCVGTSPMHKYTYEMMESADSALFKLSAECATLSEVQVFGGCELMASDNQDGLKKGLYSFKIKVTDQGGLASVVPVDVQVDEAFTTLEVMEWSAHHEGGREQKLSTVGIAENHHHVAKLEAGTVILSDWNGESRPEIKVLSGPFELTELVRHRYRRSATEYKWNLYAKAGSLSVIGDQPKTLTVKIEVASQLQANGDTVTGFTSEFRFVVQPHKPTKNTIKICSPDAGVFADCDWARNMEEVRSKSMTVDAFALPKTTVATLQYADHQTDAAINSDVTYAIALEYPTYDIFEIRDNKLVLNKKPQAINDGKGTGQEISAVTIAAKDASGLVISKFTIGFKFEYCGASMKCNALHTKQCVSAATNSYTCECERDFAGTHCDVVLEGSSNLESVDDGKPVGDSDDSSPGTIVAVVVTVLVLIVLLVGAVLFVQARNARNAETMKGLGSSNYAANPAMGGMPPAPFVRGRKNAKTYPYYNPSASKQAAYQELSNADAGSFVIRDNADGSFALHLKTAQMLIKDEVISVDGRSVTLVGHGDQPEFPCVPMLVEHYASDMDVDAPLQLSVSNPIYFRGDGSSIYDNAAIKGVKTGYQAADTSI